MHPSSETVSVKMFHHKHGFRRNESSLTLLTTTNVVILCHIRNIRQMGITNNTSCEFRSCQLMTTMKINRRLIELEEDRCHETENAKQRASWPPPQIGASQEQKVWLIKKEYFGISRVGTQNLNFRTMGGWRRVETLWNCLILVKIQSDNERQQYNASYYKTTVSTHDRPSASFCNKQRSEYTSSKCDNPTEQCHSTESNATCDLLSTTRHQSIQVKLLRWFISLSMRYIQKKILIYNVVQIAVGQRFYSCYGNLNILQSNKCCCSNGSAKRKDKTLIDITVCDNELNNTVDPWNNVELKQHLFKLGTKLHQSKRRRK